MKPRAVGPLTDEDRAIWLALTSRNSAVRWFEQARRLAQISCTQDRCDASLMYRAQHPANRRATDLWLPSTLWAAVRGIPAC